MEKEDVEFMTELEAAAHLKPNKASQIFLWTIFGLFIWCFLWAAISEVDERVRGQGQVMPSSDTQVVQSLEGGILTDLLVAEGERVKKGQVLLKIDDIQFASDARGIEAQMAGLKVKQARLKAESSGTEFVLDKDIAAKYPDIAATEEKLYESRKAEMQNALGIIGDDVRTAKANLEEVKTNIDKYTKNAALLRKELAITKELVEKQAQPEIELIRLERELNETEGNLASAAQSQAGLGAKLSAAQRKEEEKLGGLRSQSLGELNDVESRIAAIEESLKSAKDKVDRTDLKSPVDGVVQKLYIKTKGGVVEPARKLVEIVPVADDLMIRAKISPSDVAFLKPGQEVRVNVTAYDPQIYGSLKGKLERISADTTEDNKGNIYFEIDVRTEKGYLGDEDHPLPITAGMVAETEVIVGRRTILTYLMKPVLRAKDRALTEK